ncbi:hypothetical protein ACIA5D_01850 [Actinoplanes sp. NPDC051513]
MSTLDLGGRGRFTLFTGVGGDNHVCFRSEGVPDPGAVLRDALRRVLSR